MLKDKDIDASMEAVKGKFSTVITLTVNNPRTMLSEELAEICRGNFENVLSFHRDYIGAVKKALSLAKKENATVMVCGSLYLAGDLRPILIDSLGNKK